MSKPYQLPAHVKALPHRERIMAKRALADRYRPDPILSARLLTNEECKRFGLPHQGKRECERRVSRAA